MKLPKTSDDFFPKVVDVGKSKFSLSLAREAISKFSTSSLVPFFVLLNEVPYVIDVPPSTVSSFAILLIEKIFEESILRLSKLKFFVLFGLYISEILGVK